VRTPATESIPLTEEVRKYCKEVSTAIPLCHSLTVFHDNPLHHLRRHCLETRASANGILLRINDQVISDKRNLELSPVYEYRRPYLQIWHGDRHFLDFIYGALKLLRII